MANPSIYAHEHNPDWEFIKEEVENALVLYNEFHAGSDAVADCDVARILGEALCAIAEHNGILTHIYGKEPA